MRLGYVVAWSSAEFYPRKPANPYTLQTVGLLKVFFQAKSLIGYKTSEISQERC